MAAIFLPFVLTWFAFQAAAPPPPPPVPAEAREKITELGKRVAALKQKRVNADLLHDVEIYYKAGLWLLDFPEETFSAQDLPNLMQVLDQGLERAAQLAAGEAPWTAQTGRRIHGFRSQLDGSLQLYGMRVPANYDPAKPARLYVFLHGRNQKNSELNFIHTFQRAGKSHTDAEDLGQLQLDVYGRWNGMAYHITGEADLMEALAEVKRRYKIDEDRIILRGFSMGGCGAWHIAMHYPSLWAAAEIGAGTYPRRAMMDGFPPYQAGPLRIWENILDWSLNFFNLPLAGHGGEEEKGSGAIPPPPPGEPARGQLESSMRVRAQLEREGFPLEGDSYEMRALGTNATFFVSKNTGHSTSPEVRAKLDAFLRHFGDRGRVSPDHLRFLTYTTRYNTSHWATIEEMNTLYERAEIDATRIDGGQRIQATTRNIARLTLRELDKAKEVVLDSQSIAVKPAPQITFARTAQGWEVETAPPGGLRKVHALQGPIEDAFLDPFLIVRPSGTPWNQAAHEQSLRIHDRFVRIYAKHLRARPRTKLDRDVTAADLANFHIIAFGDPGSNRILARALPRLPLRWTREQTGFGNDLRNTSEALPAMIYPNPLNPKKYIVVNTGLTSEEREIAGEYQLPRLGDYALLKIEAGKDFPDIVLAGLFNQRWAAE
jgi:pimeloyl-ACP methyl ester carboxylesterase